MAILNTTPNRAYPEPALGNDLATDVGRLVAALRAIDEDVATALSQIVAKASLASPAFTGTPTAPTAAPGDDSGKIANTAFVQAAIAALVGLAPVALDTIYELASASEANSDLIDLLEAAVALKADKATTYTKAEVDVAVSGIDLSTKADKNVPFVDVASAATVDLGAASSTSVNITGTTGITSFGTSAPDGAEYLLKFPNALTITASASIVSYTGADIVTFPGMQMRVRKEAAAWRVAWITPRVDVSGGGSSRVALDASALTAWRSLVLPDSDVNLGDIALPRNVVRITTSGTYTKPANLKAAKIIAVGGGGGGYAGTNGSPGTGGGTAVSLLDAASIPASVSCTIGSGGTGATGLSRGTSGGATSFGSLVAASGGTGGGSDASYGTPGVGTVGQILLSGTRGIVFAAGTTSTYASIGGAAQLIGLDGVPAVANTGAGGQGGGAASPATNGASGVIIIEEYY